MKNRLVASFGGVADRESKHLGKKTFLGRLTFGRNLFGVPGRRIDRTLLSRRSFGPSPFGALGLGRLARGTEPGLMVPTSIRVPMAHLDYSKLIMIA